MTSCIRIACSHAAGEYPMTPPGRHLVLHNRHPSGQITCSHERTHHVLPTSSARSLLKASDLSARCLTRDLSALSLSQKVSKAFLERRGPTALAGVTAPARVATWLASGRSDGPRHDRVREGDIWRSRQCDAAVQVLPHPDVQPGAGPAPALLLDLQELPGDGDGVVGRDDAP